MGSLLECMYRLQRVKISADLAHTQGLIHGTMYFPFFPIYPNPWYMHAQSYM